MKQIPSIAEYSPKQSRAAEEVMGLIERTGERMESQFGVQRKSERRKLHTEITVLLNPDSRQERRFTAWSHSISGGGLGFYCPGELEASRALIALQISNQETCWMDCEIVRSKSTGIEDFWEYGVKFVARATV